jgi:hypothetical protein
MAISFYNAGDNAIYDSGQHFVPQEKYRLGYTPPATPEPLTNMPVNGGITNTNAFNNSGGNNFNPAGNAFGYGSQIEPGGSYGSYDSINYTGGLPGDVQQYGVGRQFEDPSASPIGETYSYKKEVPGLLRAGAAFIPGGNFLLNLAEKRMNANRDQPPGNYKIGGLDESMKGYYDNLAGSGMLYNGPGGVKTLTGKNFTGKGYLEGQLDIYNDKFAGMTEEEIEELKNDPRKQFKYKQYLESSQMYKTNKAQKKNKENMANLAAAESRRESARQYDPAVHGPTNYGLGSDGNQSYDSGNQGFGTNATSGGPVSNKTGRGRTDYMEGGRAGYFFGGRVNYKAGGRTDAESQYGADSVGSYDSSQNKSGRQQSYGGGNDNPSFYEPKTSVFNNPEILSKETIIGDVPMGIGFDNSYGRYKATMDLKESLKKKGLEGEIEYNNNIGNFDLAAKYNTQDGPSYGAGYTGNNFDVGVNNKTGASANYSKDIFDGRGKITAGGTYNPNGTYNAEGKIIFNYANGGLASIL